MVRSPFSIFKLRTMSVQPTDAPAEDQNWHSAHYFTGRILRCFRFDELPQLFNVVTGEMSQ